MTHIEKGFCRIDAPPPPLSFTENPSSARAWIEGISTFRWTKAQDGTSSRKGRGGRGKTVFCPGPLDRLVRAIRFESGGSVKVVELPNPQPRPDEVLVQVLVAGV